MATHRLLNVTLPILAGLVLLAMGTYSLSSNGKETVESKSSSVLRHVVLFKFKETSAEADVQKVVEAFRSLKDAIPQVADFEFGTNNSPEGLDTGLTHCFLVTFKSEKDRAIYLPHPKHLEFVELLKPHLDRATVVDYWSKY